MIISYSQGFIFVHIHKTAGDSITSAIKPALPRSDIVIMNDWPPWVHWARKPPKREVLVALRKHSPAQAIVRVVSPDVWGQSFTFAFVRHPIGRTVSLYRYASRKLQERRSFHLRNAAYLAPPLRWSDPLRWRAVRAFVDTAGSFSEFIRHPIFERDASMVSQWYLLTDPTGRLLVDFVGRFETLQDDFSAVQERIGLPKTTLPCHNASHQPTEQPVHVTDDDRAYLGERFRADFTQFTYDPATDL